MHVGNQAIIIMLYTLIFIIDINFTCMFVTVCVVVISYTDSTEKYITERYSVCWLGVSVVLC